MTNFRQNFKLVMSFLLQDTLERKLKATEDNLATANDKIKELETSLHSQK